MKKQTGLKLSTCWEERTNYPWPLTRELSLSSLVITSLAFSVVSHEIKISSYLPYPCSNQSIHSKYIYLSIVLLNKCLFSIVMNYFSRFITLVVDREGLPVEVVVVELVRLSVVFTGEDVEQLLPLPAQQGQPVLTSCYNNHSLLFTDMSPGPRPCP